jgi:lactate permease
MIWAQNYNPLGSVFFSTLAAGVPLILLLGSIGFLRVRIHWAALMALAAALLLAICVYGMPWPMALASAGYGAAFGLFPVGWIVLNIIFFYELTVHRGLFEVLRRFLGGIAPDPRIQVILIAFSFGAFIEGMAGFGTPVAITAAILIQLGFHPLHASGLSLIANTAPVAFGSLGIPITTLEQVTGLDARAVSAMVGRQLPFFSVIIPFWVVGAFSGWRGLRPVWPAALVAGLAFAIPQFLISNFHGPWLVDTISGVCSIAATALLLRFWKPRDAWTRPPETFAAESSSFAPSAPLSSVRSSEISRSDTVKACIPWMILTLCILFWGTPGFKAALDRRFAPSLSIPHLHRLVQRQPPVAAPGVRAEAAEFKLNLLSATGTGILAAAVIAGAWMRYSIREWLSIYQRALWRVRLPLVTIGTMLALGHVTKYSGADATLGLALARTGLAYPFFAALLGWLGVALTGSDTASNVLFGSLQTITAGQLHLSPILMGAANSSGGVMGKMVDAQSIVVASTATNWYGQEGRILRFVFLHSAILASLMGLLVWLQARVPPFTALVVK